MSDLNRPLLGEPNAPCRTCGAPLAADQRYCLQCGTRRAEARLPFLEILARQVPASAASVETTTRTTQTGPSHWLGRVSTNAAAVAGVACLLLALGIGVLIGGLGSDSASGNDAAPQIITVGGGAAAPAAATSAAPAETSTTADSGSSDSSSSDSKKKSSSSSSSKASSSKASSEVKDLDKSSGSDYSKKSEKLPKTLGTGGAPPPKDTSGKAIGGGSDVEAIG